MENEEFDTYFTKDVVCPWCGEHSRPPTGYEKVNGLAFSVTCPACSSRFTLHHHITVSYSTSKEVVANGQA